jgi:hypothetical protein
VHRPAAAAQHGPAAAAAVEGETLRERIDRHTGKGTCGEGCHGYLINPLGFAFENYDPLGRVADHGRRQARRRRRRVPVRRRPQSYDGAVELAHLMADSDEAHRCYVGHLLEYGYARARRRPTGTSSSASPPARSPAPTRSSRSSSS